MGGKKKKGGKIYNRHETTIFKVEVLGGNVRKRTRQTTLVVLIEIDGKKELIYILPELIQPK